MPTQAAGAPASPAPSKRLVDKQMRVVAALGFVAGFVDAAGFVALAGLFTAHVSGNLVLIAAELVTRAGGVWLKLLALPAFVLGVAATRLIARGLERRGVAAFRPLVLLQAVVLLAFLAAGVALSPFASPDTAGSICVGMLGVAAMSVQNAVARLSLPHVASTTAMTVNVTQTVIDAVDLCLDRRGRASEGTVARIRHTLPAVAGFGVGALAGAFGVAAVSFWSLLAPVAVLLGLLGTDAGKGQDLN